KRRFARRVVPRSLKDHDVVRLGRTAVDARDGRKTRSWLPIPLSVLSLWRPATSASRRRGSSTARTPCTPTPTTPPPTSSCGPIRKGLEGHGLTFTIGRGTEICVVAVRAFEPFVVGRTLEGIQSDMRAFWRSLV